VGALKSLGGDLAGEYTALAGMGQAARSSLASEGLLFDKPDSPLTLASGFGRHWPEARGVFTNEAHTLAAWVNQEDHLLIFSSEPGAGLWEAFARFVRAEGAIKESLQSQGHGFARSEALGVLTADPSKAGSGGFQARVTVRLTLVSGQADFKAVCKGLKVVVKETAELGVWSISKMGILGQSEVEVLSAVATACQTLVEMEIALEKGEGSA
jgi:protein-arginine kinase